MSTISTPPSTPKIILLTAVTGAFTFMLSLAWNNFIQTAINYYFHEGNSIKAQLLYAIVVTLIAVLSIYYLSKFQ